jgi:quinol monooxygenase YgiN
LAALAEEGRDWGSGLHADGGPVARGHTMRVRKGAAMMSSKDLVFFVELHLKPERVAGWKSAVTALIDRMAQEETFVTCLWHQGTEDPNTFMLYERWREPSPEAFVKNQMKDYRRAYEERLPALLQSPRKPRILIPVREWHR